MDESCEYHGSYFAIVLSLLAIFLILLVLVQRGRGGGLAGALGGMGGSSAFGAKAGDIFTRITIITASIWIVFCLFALMWAKHRGDALGYAAIATSSSMPTARKPPSCLRNRTSNRHQPAGCDAHRLQLQRAYRPQTSRRPLPATPPAASPPATPPAQLPTAPAPAADATNKDAAAEQVIRLATHIAFAE